ncbi:MAG TPA: hypothetical protein VMT20_23550 [Terriglobia bacterium]|nr:hypothetical protein [Terriglobia bacterium]
MKPVHESFRMVRVSPEAISTDHIRKEVANSREPYELYKLKVFDNDGPFDGNLEVAWFPGHRHIELCWDTSADVPRLMRDDNWWGWGTESADVRGLTDGIGEFLNHHEKFAAEKHYEHLSPSLGPTRPN